MREVLLNNFWWKVTALLLAILAWLGVQGENARDLLPTTKTAWHYMIAHPVTISKPATDTREFKVTPAEVDITLRGEEKFLRELSATEIRAEVWASDYKGDTNTLPIHVFVPNENIKLERVSPERVQVEVLKP